MGKYKELVHKLPEERKTMEDLTDITDEFIETIKITHPQKYNTFIEKVQVLLDEGHFTEEKLMEVKETSHDRFTVEDTTKYAKEGYEIDFSQECFNEYDFNFIMNEMYCIFKTIYHEEMDKYTELSLSWLDHFKGKALWYYEKLY